MHLNIYFLLFEGTTCSAMSHFKISENTPAWKSQGTSGCFSQKMRLNLFTCSATLSIEKLITSALVLLNKKLPLRRIVSLWTAHLIL